MMPADAAVHQHLGELVLGGAARGLGREHRGVPLPGQGLPDDLGERGEYRVLQLRGDQADEARAAPPQPHRAFVAEHVECGKDGFAGGRGDAGLAVEHAADCRFADPRLGCDVGKPRGHRIGLYRSHLRLPTTCANPPGMRTAAGSIRSGGRDSEHGARRGDRTASGPRLTVQTKCRGRRRKASTPSGRRQPLHAAARAEPRLLAAHGERAAVELQGGAGSPAWAATLRSLPAVRLRQPAGRPTGRSRTAARSPDHGSGTRHPSRVPSCPVLRKNAGSWRTSSGSSATSGRPSSSPW